MKKTMSMNVNYQKVKHFWCGVYSLRCLEKMLKICESAYKYVIKKRFKKRYLKKILKKEKIFIINFQLILFN